MTRFPCLNQHSWIAAVRVTAITAMVVSSACLSAPAAETPSIAQRFAPPKDADQAAKTESLPDESPDFRRHVLPLMGRVGCNGRACHGSFQGQGGFRLSLFGYDFKNDHDALGGIQTTLDGKPIPGKAGKVDPRYNTAKPADSLILTKPTLIEDHEGGKRFEIGSWEYRVLRKWIVDGAKGLPETSAEFASLDVEPKEIVFKKPGETVQLRVIAKWQDGTSEDVTAISRFRTNDESIAKIDENGKVVCLNKGDTHVVAFYDNGVAPVPTMLPVSDLVDAKYPAVATPTKIDQLVVTKLRKVGIVPSGRSDDAEFLRRVRLDLTGTLPTPAEIEAFLADTAQDKRTKKVDQLLETPEYAAWWTTRLSDLTGNNPRQFNAGQYLKNLPALWSRQWYGWMYERVKSNKPYDEIVAGLLVADSMEDGQSYEDYNKQLNAEARAGDADSFVSRHTMPHYWARRNFRTPEEKVMGFCYTFMGIQIQCAQCHKHPFDQWTKSDFDKFKPMFDRTTTGLTPEDRKKREELVKALGTTTDPKTQPNEYRKELEKLVREGKDYPIETVVFTRAPAKIDPKAAEKAEMRAEKNPKAAQNAKRQVPVAKPVMAKILGGEEVNTTVLDDPRETLMTWLRTEPNRFLARAFVNRVWANYFNVGIIHPTDDANLANPPSNEALLKYLTDGFVEHKYDMKWLHREICASDTYQRTWKPNDTNALDTRNFSRSIPRRIPAEVAYDALTMATAGKTELDKMNADPKERAIGIAGTLSQGNGNLNYPLVVFGKPERAVNCDCERSNEPSLLQCVFTQNDGQLLSQLDRNTGWLKQLDQEWKGVARDAEKVEQTKKSADREDRKNLIAMLENRIVKAKKNPDRKDDVPQLERKLAELKAEKAAGEAKPSPDSTSAKPAAPKVDPDALINEAYLRTLSRKPLADELTRAKQYMTDAATPAAGLRDVLWALVNTKEFIVNH
ncbi:MAG: DUF1549 domain-containing protein [Pirellulales bacterium]